MRRDVGKYMTDEDYRKASQREEHVGNEIHRLSNGKLKVEYKGFGTKVPRKLSSRPVGIQPLDLEVDERIIIEVMGSDRWTYESSGFFPVALDKVDRAKQSEKPVYFVFVLGKEPQFDDWWINAKDCEKYPLEYDSPTIYGPQDIYKTDKRAWTHGLKSLVKELLRITH